MNKSKFRFDVSKEAASHNFKLLKEHQFDLSKIVNSENSTSTHDLSFACYKSGESINPRILNKIFS